MTYLIAGLTVYVLFMTVVLLGLASRFSKFETQLNVVLKQNVDLWMSQANFNSLLIPDPEQAKKMLKELEEEVLRAYGNESADQTRH